MVNPVVHCEPDIQQIKTATAKTSLSTNTQLNILSSVNTKLNVNERESNLRKHEGKYLLTELGIFLRTKSTEKVNENIFKYDTFAVVR